MDEYSEEVRDIVDRMPTHWCRHTALIMLVVIIVFFTLSFVIKYPDTVDGQISVTGSEAPIRLVAKMSGRLHLLEQQDSFINIGTPIAYIENGAIYTDIVKLKKRFEFRHIIEDKKGIKCWRII